MSAKPRVIISGFADEAANQKTAEQQFSAFAALGLQYYTVRFVDAGNGIKNVMKLTKSEITKIRHLEDEYGLNVASVGSPIGKVKLVDVDRRIIFRHCSYTTIPIGHRIKNPVGFCGRGQVVFGSTLRKFEGVL